MRKIHPMSIFRSFASRYALPRNRHCILCGKKSYCFLPYRVGAASLSPFAKMVHIVGSDVENFACPWCGCSDRERHLWMYFQAMNLIEGFEGASILHFAPESQLSAKIISVKPGKYVLADICPTRAEIEIIDMLSICYEDNTFDFVIANHVLEHVDDDQKALKEIYRVLKPRGYAILQTPYSTSLHSTWSDPGIQSQEARFMAYGQEDHARVFGKDIFERFSRSGLIPNIQNNSVVAEDYSPEVHGINPEEPLFLFRKPEKKA